MKYAWIEKNKLRWPVYVQCRVLGVSASGYRQHVARRKKILTRRHLSETALVVEIRAVYAAARGAYGWPCVWRQLKAQGIHEGKRRVQRAMQPPCAAHRAEPARTLLYRCHAEHRLGRRHDLRCD